MQIELGGHFRLAAAKFDSRMAVQSARRSLTYRELRESANRIGSGIMRLGAGRGDRVAVLSHNSVEIVELWIALEQWGFARVAMHTHFEMAVHARTLNDVGAAVLFFDTRFTAAVEAHRAEMKSVRFFVAIGPNAPSWAMAYEVLMSQGDIDDPALDADESEICAIQFTTGTTGFPKPWIVTHRAWRALIANNLEHLDTFGPNLPSVGRDDVNLHIHALQWASGAQTLMPYMLRGAKNIILDDERFNPVQIIDTIVTEGVTGVFVPAPMLPPILELIGARGGIEHKLQRMVIFFATPELLQAVTATLGPVWCHGFGSTEQGAPTTRLTCQEAQEKPARLASVGRNASPFFEMAVVDERGTRLKPGQVGEIVVRSAMSTSQYWNLPDKTEESFLPGGWFRPNDIGYLDEEGFLYYLDRAKDRIHTGAGIVYPHVVESALLRHDTVAHCGVVGIGTIGTQEVVAAVLLKPNIAATPAIEREILEAARSALAASEVPKRIVFVPDLPTVLGGAKVQREVLQQRLAAAT
ncbi:MAG TPA: class I adenylate-forming enzyme family protein [Bradyrhizobium sp.]|nr:class I adenylate-forming enzyme family protein [Bradyrhizobium sp.]